MTHVLMIEMSTKPTQVNMPDSTPSPLRFQRLLDNTAQRNRPRQLQVETRLHVPVEEKEPGNKIPPSENGWRWISWGAYRVFAQ